MTFKNKDSTSAFGFKIFNHQLSEVQTKKIRIIAISLRMLISNFAIESTHRNHRRHIMRMN